MDNPLSLQPGCTDSQVPLQIPSPPPGVKGAEGWRGNARDTRCVCSGPGYQLQGPYHCALRLGWAGLHTGDLVPLAHGTEKRRSGGKAEQSEKEAAGCTMKTLLLLLLVLPDVVQASGALHR